MWNMCGLCVGYVWNVSVIEYIEESREESVEYELRVETVELKVGLQIYSLSKYKSEKSGIYKIFVRYMGYLK